SASSCTAGAWLPGTVSASSAIVRLGVQPRMEHSGLTPSNGTRPPLMGASMPRTISWRISQPTARAWPDSQAMSTSSWNTSPPSSCRHGVRSGMSKAAAPEPASSPCLLIVYCTKAPRSTQGYTGFGGLFARNIEERPDCAGALHTPIPLELELVTRVDGEDLEGRAGDSTASGGI